MFLLSLSFALTSLGATFFLPQSSKYWDCRVYSTMPDLLFLSYINLKER